MLCDKHLVGLLLCIFVKKDLESNIRDVRTCSTGVGIMGVLGNKGGVGISMNVFDSSICFLSAHLAAHSENVEGRNLDFKNIIERSLFPCEGSPDLRDDSPSDQVIYTVLWPRITSNDIAYHALCSALSHRDTLNSI